MTTAAQSPGPWKAVKEPHGPIDIFDSNDHDIVTLYGSIANPARQQANARLIAAAPDFYNAAMLRRVYEALPADRGGVNGPKGKARTAWLEAEEAAIAKAEGRNP